MSEMWLPNEVNVHPDEIRTGAENSHAPPKLPSLLTRRGGRRPRPTTLPTTRGGRRPVPTILPGARLPARRSAVVGLGRPAPSRRGGARATRLNPRDEPGDATQPAGGAGRRDSTRGTSRAVATQRAGGAGVVRGVA